jgi:hypothetical protein
MRQLDTEYLLQQYGLWLRVQAGIPHYVSPSFALLRDNVQIDRGIDPAITDDLAMLLDRLVCRLYRRYPGSGMALWNFYRYQGMSYRQLGRLMGCSHVRAQELVTVGAAWVDSALCHHAEAA